MAATHEFFRFVRYCKGEARFLLALLGIGFAALVLWLAIGYAKFRRQAHAGK